MYTGRDMAASHKHLGITDEEWGSFIDGLHEVCDELGLPASNYWISVSTSGSQS